MEDAAVIGTARRIATARLGPEPLKTLDAGLRPADDAEGYAIQKAVHRLLAESGNGEIVGYKVGATEKDLQESLGLSGPAAGGMTANGIHPSGVGLRRSRYRAPAVECEIALILDADLDGADVPYTRASVAGAVATCHAAIEVIDDRYEDLSSMDGPTLIADDMLHAACVLGRPVRPGADLAAARGMFRVNGRAVGSGRGADLMGHPYEVLAWLANRLAEVGQPLLAGHVVMCGSVVAPVWLADQPGGDLEVAASFDGLGEARATFR
ncbi:MAG: fumarylacetoacetate hydrolase family protein [Kiloniellales bacterium]